MNEFTVSSVNSRNSLTRLIVSMTVNRMSCVSSKTQNIADSKAFKVEACSYQRLAPHIRHCLGAASSEPFSMGRD